MVVIFEIEEFVEVRKRRERGRERRWT